MKKTILLFAAILITTNIHPDSDKKTSCDCQNSGKSYLSLRPLFQSVSPEYISAFRSDRTNACSYQNPSFHTCGNCCWDSALQVVFFGSTTTNEKELGRFFLPFCKDILLFNEQLDSAPNTKGDIFPRHFNIVTKQGTFESCVSFRPQQTVVGAGFHYRQSIYQSECYGRGIWASISFPIIHMKNDLGFCENIKNDGGGADTDNAPNSVASVREAFQQSAWKFGRLKERGDRNTEVGDVEIKIGYEWLQHEPCHLESYIGVVFPAGSKVDEKAAEHIFPAIVGNGHHVGFMLGGAFGAEVWRCGSRSLRIEYATHSQYLFEEKQIRSLDLKNKPWSRYIEMYETLQQAQTANINNDAFLSTPGINILTQHVNVTPGLSYNITTALVYSGCWFHAELGYNLYARRAECVELECPWNEGPAIKARDGEGQTNPIRDITGNFYLENATIVGQLPVPITQYPLSIIKEDDLDLVSAANPAGISQTIFGAAGLEYNITDCLPGFISIGGSYEFAKDNSGLADRWVAWFKTGLSL